MPKEFVSETVFYDYKTPVTEALDKVKRLGAVVITRSREYYGMVDYRSIFANRALKSLDLKQKAAIGKFARKLPVLDPETSLGRLISYFHESGAKALPYQEGDKITGVVTRSVVLSTILSLHVLSKARANEAMSAPLVSIDSDSNIAQAMTAMDKNHVTKLAVLDNEKLAGLLSQGDISDMFAKPRDRLPEKKSYSYSPANIPVRSTMKTSVYTTDYNSYVEDAIRQMLEKRVSSLVVTRGPRPVGVLTARDVIEAAAAATAKTQSKVIISGLDDYTRESEDSIRAAMDRLVEKIDKFERLEVDYASINVKRSRERNYELKARLSLAKKGTVFAHATGYSLDSTMTDLLDKVYKRVKEQKDFAVSKKRLSERYYGE